MIPPEIELKLSSSPVNATLRKLKAVWSLEAIEDLRQMIGDDNINSTPLQEFAEAIEDKFEITDEESLNEWRKTKKNEKIIQTIAQGMRDEIDKEILKTIAQTPSELTTLNIHTFGSVAQKIGATIHEALIEAKNGKTPTQGLTHKIRALLHEQDIQLKSRMAQLSERA